jgi:hypothetical protein
MAGHLKSEIFWIQITVLSCFVAWEFWNCHCSDLMSVLHAFPANRKYRTIMTCYLLLVTLPSNSWSAKFWKICRRDRQHSTLAFVLPWSTTKAVISIWIGSFPDLDASNQMQCSWHSRTQEMSSFHEMSAGDPVLSKGNFLIGLFFHSNEIIWERASRRFNIRFHRSIRPCFNTHSNSSRDSLKSAIGAKTGIP